jgi:hypothetical protein
MLRKPPTSISRVFFSATIFLPLAASALAQAEEPAGTKRAIIICGHPGDEEHREMFAESIVRIRESLTGRFGFPQPHVWVWFGIDDADESSLEPSRGPATKEALEGGLDELKKQLREDDELWVFVIGHAHYTDRTVLLNLPGPDVPAEEFGKWFAGVASRRSIFFITTPLSGYFMKPLAKPGRVVISATEADLEVNETLFHSSLATLLETFPEGVAHDLDKDGRYSLLDLYLAVTLDVAARYTEEELLATEHGQLDDNGDGRGSELQLNFPVQTDDSSAVPPTRVIQIRPDRDGNFARSIDLGRLLRRE